MIQTDRLLSRVSRFPFATDVEVGADAFYRRRPLRLAGRTQLGKVLVRDSELTGPEDESGRAILREIVTTNPTRRLMK